MWFAKYRLMFGNIYVLSFGKTERGCFHHIPCRHESRNNQNKLNWFYVLLSINHDQELYKSQKAVSITELNKQSFI